MKKLMVIAAVASLAAAAQAGIRVTNCNPRSVTCPVVGYKVTASGKIAAPVEKKDDIYKATSKLSIKKGALIIFPTSGSGNDDDCCYEAYSLYLQVKVNKETYPVGVFFQPIDSWSIFGSGYQKYLNAQGEKSKKVKVESAIGLSYANVQSGNGIATSDPNSVGLGVGADTVTGANGFDMELGLDDFAFIATAFGKGTYKYTYTESGSACNICTAEDSDFTPGNYSGWFAGLITELGGEVGCLTCACSDLDVFGGTWKATYQKNWSKSAEGWQSAASYVFGADTLADMKYGPGADADTKKDINASKEWFIE